MSKKKKISVSDEKSDTDLFQPQPGLRNSNLWKDGKPDPRLVNLIDVMAYDAALINFEAECAAKPKSNMGSKRTES